MVQTGHGVFMVLWKHSRFESLKVWEFVWQEMNENGLLHGEIRRLCSCFLSFFVDELRLEVTKHPKDFIMVYCASRLKSNRWGVEEDQKQTIQTLENEHLQLKETIKELQARQQGLRWEGTNMERGRNQIVTIYTSMKKQLVYGFIALCAKWFLLHI